MNEKASKKARGFTLIELMVSITILGLGLTIIFLRIDTFLPATRLQASCRKLVSDIDELRMAAIITYKLPVHLEYNLEAHGYGAYIPYELDEEQEIVGPGRTDLHTFAQQVLDPLFQVGAESVRAREQIQGHVTDREQQQDGHRRAPEPDGPRNPSRAHRAAICRLRAHGSRAGGGTKSCPVPPTWPTIHVNAGTRRSTPRRSRS